ncbi:MAG TPA: TonB family protein, partial [Casimicrobiaceae bacterium]|nr:TonB family protein [Casimicrobiaceae bacterium]
EAARAEAARAEAARAEAARAEKQEAEARREERLRAIGRQLDEEAAQRDATALAARQAPLLPLSLSTARRYRLFGRSDPNADIILYAEAWVRKIQLNMTIDMVREVAKQPHIDPTVTVAVRSDGSVESLTFVQSSGVPALDEAIRQVVQSQAPYQAFPPNLAREYDVIEIRRTWYFDVAIRLY